MSKIFFYGLFMDQSLLTENGLHPELVGPAVLPDYRIHIGERAPYETRLSRLVEALEFDASYAAEIAAFGDAP